MTDVSVKVREGRLHLYRQIIRDAGERVMGRRGLAKTSVEEIAREADVSIGTLYRTFPDGKADIYRAIQEHRGAEVVGLTRESGLKALHQTREIVDAFLEALAALVAYMVEHPHFLRLALRENWLTDNEHLSVEQSAVRNEGMRRTVEAFRLGIASGAFIDRDPEMLARNFIALQQAHLAHWLEHQGSAEDVLAELKETFLRTFCHSQELTRRRSVRKKDAHANGQGEKQREARARPVAMAARASEEEMHDVKDHSRGPSHRPRRGGYAAGTRRRARGGR